MHKQEQTFKIYNSESTTSNSYDIFYNIIQEKDMPMDSIKIALVNDKQY